MTMADMEYKNGSLCLDKLNVSEVETYSIENPEFLNATIDASNRIIEGILKDGTKLINKFYNNDIHNNFEEIYDSIDDINEKISNNTKIKVLVVGDSYSQGGGKWMSDMIKEFPEGSNCVSIAIGSASVKDKNKDRVTYPYSDRPVNFDNGGNKNTLCCQIDKLKRLMNGDCRGIYFKLDVKSSAIGTGSISVNLPNNIIVQINITEGDTISDIANILYTNLYNNIDVSSSFNIIQVGNSIGVEAKSSSVNTPGTVTTNGLCTINVATLLYAETPIYQNEEDYPNVIIIEGGMNDGYDNDSVVATYHDQINKIVTNVYRKQNYNSNVEIGNVTIKTPIDEVNRTCFAGAYRYLSEELLNLFPNAQIYITTCSPIGYRNGGNTSLSTQKKAEQQRLCADILQYNIIDWHRDGQINSVANYTQGSGTEDDPYIWAQFSGQYADTNDQLHPNSRGYKKYGKLAALVIKNTFLNIESF